MSDVSSAGMWTGKQVELPVPQRVVSDAGSTQASGVPAEGAPGAAGAAADALPLPLALASTLPGGVLLASRSASAASSSPSSRGRWRRGPIVSTFPLG